jgi:hypothetical protein
MSDESDHFRRLAPVGANGDKIGTRSSVISVEGDGVMFPCS